MISLEDITSVLPDGPTGPVTEIHLDATGKLVVIAEVIAFVTGGRITTGRRTVKSIIDNNSIVGVTEVDALSSNGSKYIEYICGGNY